MLLVDYQQRNLTFSEKGKRISIRPEQNEIVQAYDIQRYFNDLYDGQARRPQSADGLYLGRLPDSRNFTIVIELEGDATSFEDAAQQVKATIEHLCNNFERPMLRDDGYRLHQSAADQYPVNQNHEILGIVVGSSAGRLPGFKPGKTADIRWIISRIPSRSPNLQYSLQTLCQEIQKNFR